MASGKVRTSGAQNWICERPLDAAQRRQGGARCSSTLASRAQATELLAEGKRKYEAGDRMAALNVYEQTLGEVRCTVGAAVSIPGGDGGVWRWAPPDAPARLCVLRVPRSPA